LRNAALLRHPVIREWVLISLLLIVGSVCALKWGWFFRLDQTLYDDAIELLHRAPQDDIVIVAIDEESLRQIGRFPWPRAVHATLLDKLTSENAKVIAFDVVLTEPDTHDPNADRVLGESIRNNGRVILPLGKRVADGEMSGDALPVAPFATAAAMLAQIDAELDQDGIVRSVYLRAGAGEARYPSLSVAMLLLADPTRWPAPRRLPGEANPLPTRAGQHLVRDNLYRVPFAGPPGHYKIIPYVDVLRGDFPPGSFNAKFVLVGSTASGLRDEFPTPVSGQASAMPGIEIHANILQGLREGIDIRTASAVQTGAITVMALLMVMLAYLWLSPRHSLLLTGAMMVLVLAGSALLFRHAHWWCSPVLPMLALLLAYPLWSWRKLEATQRFFDDELERLEREPIVVPQETADRISPQVSHIRFAPDVIENRIVTLQAATARMRNLNRFVADSLESVPELVLVTDSGAHVLFANTSADRMFAAFNDQGEAQQVAKSLEGSDLFELLAMLRHTQNRTWREIWTDAFEKTKSISLEATGPGDHEFLLSIAPSFSARGVSTGSIVTMVDVSPLRESERRRDEALRFLSHDMRSPQASILTLLEMQREQPGVMPVERLIERIGKYSRRTLNLADDFLRLAKAERARVQDFVPVEMHELMRDAAEEAWSLASTKKISVTVIDDGHDAWVMGDRDLLTRALINLLSNAVKYSPAGTGVSLCLRRDAGDWILDITDQGYGIADADLSKLFTRFSRLQREGQPEEDGIGLGLVFVKTVVERHHGSIKVSSKTTQGESGTTFSVRLPMAEPPAD
jgi:CHASE2 domain-containing sensor protein/signal transduction histidine kinase